MVLGTEYNSLATFIAISLAALKNSLAIMQGCVSRAYRNILIRNDAGIMPAFLWVVVHLKHIISEYTAKTYLADISWFLL